MGNNIFNSTLKKLKGELKIIIVGVFFKVKKYNYNMKLKGGIHYEY